MKTLLKFTLDKERRRLGLDESDLGVMIRREGNERGVFYVITKFI